jgi:CRP/FNR family transcriptional regulator
MRFHFRGDFLGLAFLAFSRSPETVTAVTDAVVHPFTRERLAALLGDHPRLAPMLLAINVADRVSLADRLASIGRTSARARVSSLFCELFTRLRALGLTEDNVFQLPLTQEEIGDSTGLTAVHVNRMVRSLVEEGIIERNGGGHVRVLDEKRLCADAAYADRSELDTSWIPAST